MYIMICWFDMTVITLYELDVFNKPQALQQLFTILRLHAFLAVAKFEHCYKNILVFH